MVRDRLACNEWTDKLAERVRWLDQEQDAWDQSFMAALDDAVAHLQALIFVEGWDEIVAGAGSPEAALRESVTHYERGLTNLFSFMRASGFFEDAVAWSSFKADRRRAALEMGVEITLRTALETGLYVPERTSLGDHAIYLAWVRGLMLFLQSLTSGAAVHPGHSVDQESQLAWAYSILAPLEDENVFHSRFTEFLSEVDNVVMAQGLAGVSVDAILQHEADLLSHPRFDLLLNTALSWLASAGGRWLE